MALALKNTGSLRLAAMGAAEFALFVHITLAGWIRALDTGWHGLTPVMESLSVGLAINA